MGIARAGVDCTQFKISKQALEALGKVVESLKQAIQFLRQCDPKIAAEYASAIAIWLKEIKNDVNAALEFGRSALALLGEEGHETRSMFMVEEGILPRCICPLFLKEALSPLPL